jgi:uncharacterized protein
MVAGREAGHRILRRHETGTMTEHLDLADWRRLVAAMYAELRADPDPGAERLATVRAERDRLFADHPQSPIATAERLARAGERLPEART